MTCEYVATNSLIHSSIRPKWKPSFGREYVDCVDSENVLMLAHMLSGSNKISSNRINYIEIAKKEKLHK